MFKVNNNKDTRATPMATLLVFLLLIFMLLPAGRVLNLFKVVNKNHCHHVFIGNFRIINIVKCDFLTKNIYVLCDLVPFVQFQKRESHL